MKEVDDVSFLGLVMEDDECASIDFFLILGDDREQQRLGEFLLDTMTDLWAIHDHYSILINALIIIILTWQIHMIMHIFSPASNI